jgi:hypothetical protein
VMLWSLSLYTVPMYIAANPANVARKIEVAKMVNFVFIVGSPGF